MGGGAWLKKHFEAANILRLQKPFSKKSGGHNPLPPPAVPRELYFLRRSYWYLQFTSSSETSFFLRFTVDDWIMSGGSCCPLS